MVISDEIHKAFDSGEVQSLHYVTRYAVVDISRTFEGLIVVAIDSSERYFYTSLSDASNMLYSVGVRVASI